MPDTTIHDAVKYATVITNVVTTATTQNRFDLNEICRLFPDATYRPQVFPGLCIRLKRPKTATLLFNTGKMVCAGARSIRASKRTIHRVLRLLQSRGIIVDLSDMTLTVRNIVATADLSARVDLERASYTLSSCMYEPEMFPGMIYRMAEPKVVFLVFNSGKIVITGATTAEQIPRAADKLREILAAHNLLYTGRT